MRALSIFVMRFIKQTLIPYTIHSMLPFKNVKFLLYRHIKHNKNQYKMKRFNRNAMILKRFIEELKIIGDTNRSRAGFFKM